VLAIVLYEVSFFACLKFCSGWINLISEMKTQPAVAAKEG
jgi:hypothetical protein